MATLGEIKRMTFSVNKATESTRSKLNVRNVDFMLDDGEGT